MTASLVMVPSSVAAAARVMNENWSKVSKHALAKSSRSLRLESVSGRVRGNKVLFLKLGLFNIIVCIKISEVLDWLNLPSVPYHLL